MGGEVRAWHYARCQVASYYDNVAMYCFFYLYRHSHIISQPSHFYYSHSHIYYYSEQMRDRRDESQARRSGKSALSEAEAAAEATMEKQLRGPRFSRRVFFVFFVFFTAGVCTGPRMRWPTTACADCPLAALYTEAGGVVLVTHWRFWPGLPRTHGDR
ncbi:hypothetical protein T492DRAFT_514255 [Pavlovales sp. CCMP2436]|nr:hypothetical protein T492DRAFT_514255 [Pavlovales sp. CCMP2436]